MIGKGILKGLKTGLIIAIALFALAYIVEFLNCLTCGICSDVFDRRFGICAAHENAIDTRFLLACDTVNSGLNGVLPIWKVSSFIYTFIFCGICGTIIGLIYGISAQKKEDRDKAEREVIIMQMQALRVKADTGEPDAMFELGNLYMKYNDEGRSHSDGDMAKQWYTKASIRGHEGAREAFNQIISKEEQEKQKQEINRKIENEALESRLRETVNPCSTCAHDNSSHCPYFMQRKPASVLSVGCSQHPNSR